MKGLLPEIHLPEMIGGKPLMMFMVLHEMMHVVGIMHEH